MHITFSFFLFYAKRGLAGIIGFSFLLFAIYIKLCLLHVKISQELRNKSTSEDDVFLFMKTIKDIFILINFCYYIILLREYKKICLTCLANEKWSVMSRLTVSPENDDLHYGCTYNYEMKKWFSLFKFRKKWYA